MINIREKLLSTDKKTLLMGILNVTPDSFYDGGKHLDLDKAYKRAKELEGFGADIIDIGGESTRPGADSVSIDTELSRVIPLIKRLAGNIKIPISIDTTKAEVAKQALDQGASIVNDISALRNDPDMVRIIAKYNVPIIIMHMKGTPKDMQENPYYADVIDEIKMFLQERIKWAIESGVDSENIIIDPGIGFGKRLEDNLNILYNLKAFKELKKPILVGPSRKSFIGRILDKEPCNRLYGTAASVAVAVMNGADIVRVHDVCEIGQIVKIVDAIKNSSCKVEV